MARKQRIKISVHQVVEFTEVVEVTAEERKLLEDYKNADVHMQSRYPVQVMAYDLIERLLTRKATQCWHPSFHKIRIEKP